MSKEQQAASGEVDVVRYRDSAGIVWRVYERPFPALDRRSGQSLVFESDGMIRRVRQYPPEWRGLTPDELEALSWTR